MVIIKIKVADTVIDYDYHHADFFDTRLADYAVSDEKADMCIKYTLKQSINVPPHKVLGTPHSAVYGKNDNGDIIMYIKEWGGKVTALLRHSDDYSLNTVESLPVENGAQLTDCEREYLFSGTVFNNRLIMSGGTVLHGSCIAYRGSGVVFSAPCGTGKSTHTALWKKLFGNDVVYVNDDKPAITFKGDKPFVHGTPWSGKTDLNTNVSVPLAAIVFVKRSEKNSIKRLDTPTAVCYLNDQTFPQFYDKRLFSKNLDVIEKIIKNVPIYCLSCNISDDAALLARDTIFKK